MSAMNSRLSLMDVPDELLAHCLEFMPPKSCLALSSLHSRFSSIALDRVKRSSADDCSFLQAAVECNHVSGCRAALAGGAAAWLYYPSQHADFVVNASSSSCNYCKHYCNGTTTPTSKCTESYTTPLEHAAERGHVAVVKLLLPYYQTDSTLAAESQHATEQQIVFYKALQAALRGGHFKVCQLLLTTTNTANTTSVFDINYIPALYQRASHLISAIEHNKNPETLILLLLQAGAEANKVHINGLHSTTPFQPYLAPSSALLSAIQCQRSVECVQLLLQDGAAVDAASLNGERLLCAAASIKDNHAVLKVLMKHSYSMNTTEVHLKGLEICKTSAVAHGLDETAEFLEQLQLKLLEKKCADNDEEESTVYKH